MQHIFQKPYQRVFWWRITIMLLHSLSSSGWLFCWSSMRRQLTSSWTPRTCRFSLRMMTSSVLYLDPQVFKVFFVIILYTIYNLLILLFLIFWFIVLFCFFSKVFLWDHIQNFVEELEEIVLAGFWAILTYISKWMFHYLFQICSFIFACSNCK